MPAITRSLKDLVKRQDVCGVIREFSSPEEFAGANLSHVDMLGPTIPHLHCRRTEFYFILEGTGKVVIGREIHIMQEWDLAIIPPSSPHFAIPREPMKVLVFSTPAWIPEDQVIVSGSEDLPLIERAHLIEEVLYRFNMTIPDDVSAEERTDLDVQRKKFIRDEGYPTIPLEELRGLLTFK